MQTELTINEDYKETFYVICKKPLGINEWLFHHNREQETHGLKPVGGMRTT